MSSNDTDRVFQDLKDILENWFEFMDPLKFLMFIELLEIDKEKADLSLVQFIEVKNNRIRLALNNAYNPNEFLKPFITPYISSIDVHMSHVDVKYFQPNKSNFEIKKGKWKIKES